MKTTTGCIFCPYDDTERLVAAGIPLEMPPRGTGGLCCGCGNMMVSTGEAWRAVEPGEQVEGLWMGVHGRALARCRRAMEGFLAPKCCPSCQAPFGQRDFIVRSDGILPYDRLLCPQCLEVFVAEPNGAIHQERPGELGEDEQRGLEHVRGLMRAHTTRHQASVLSSAAVTPGALVHPKVKVVN